MFLSVLYKLSTEKIQNELALNENLHIIDKPPVELSTDYWLWNRSEGKSIIYQIHGESYYKGSPIIKRRRSEISAFPRSY